MQRYTNEHYKDLVENANDLIQCVDSNGKFVYVNKTWKEKLGYKECEIKNLFLWDIIHPSSMEHCRRIFKRVIKAEPIDGVEAAFVTKNGDILSVEGNINCRFDNEGNVISTRGIFRDISRQKKLERELNKNLEKLKYHSKMQKVLFNLSTDFMNIDNNEFDNTIIYALKKLGEYVKADRVYVFKYDFEKKVCNSIYEWATEYVLEKKSREVPFSIMQDWVNKHKQGEHTFISDLDKIPESEWVKKLLKPKNIKSFLSVPMMKANECFGFVGFDFIQKRDDYNESDKNLLYQFSNLLLYAIKRRDTEMALKESEQKYKSLVENLNEVIYVLDRNARITYVSPNIETLSGYSVTEMLGKNFINFVYPKDLKDRIANFQKALRGNNLSTEYRFVTKNKGVKWISTKANPIIKDGKTIGIQGILIDITERKKSEERIEYLGSHDYLTNLYNRRVIDEKIISMDHEKNLPIAVIVIDVNGLKLTNDAFGHEMGDLLLQEVADIIAKECKREEDIAGRIGGDEFVLFLSHTDKDEAFRIKERIKEKALNTKIESIIVSLAVGYEVKTTNKQTLKDTYLKAEKYMYRNKLKYGRSMRKETIETVIRNINSKYDNEQIHTERVSQYCESIGRAFKLEEYDINSLKTAGMLHDIGKIVVPVELLNKEEKLTAEEFEIVKRHTESGYHILKSADEYAKIAEYVLHHHEKWDGTGYPKGLKGKDIPFISRIIAVADAYEAMTAKRSYQKTKTKHEAIEELKRCSGSQFDPDVVEAFVEFMKD